MIRKLMKRFACFAGLGLLMIFSGQGVSQESGVNPVKKEDATLELFHENTRIYSLLDTWKKSNVFEGEDPGLTNGWHLPQYKDEGWKNAGVPFWATPSDKNKDHFLWARKEFLLPGQFKDRNLFINFEGAAHITKVWLNGNYLGEHCGSSTPFRFNITDHVKFNEVNCLAVRLHYPVNPQGGYVYVYGTLVKYLGLYRKASIIGYPKVYIDRVLVDTHPSTESFTLRLSVKNYSSAAPDYELKYRLKEQNGKKQVREGKIAVLNIPKGETDYKFDIKVGEVIPWSPENPHLYDLSVFLENDKKETMDIWEAPIGFREFEVKGKTFYLNGKPYYIRGLHVIPEMDAFDLSKKNYMWSKEEYAKYLSWPKQANFNCLRISHEPGPENLRYAADEMGFLLIEETDWAAECLPPPYGARAAAGEKLLDNFLPSIKEMVEGQYNHPSVVAWSLCNEDYFSDNIPIHNKVYEYVRQIDPYRPISAISGDPSLEYTQPHQKRNIWGELKTDINDTHFYSGWYHGPFTYVTKETEYARNLNLTRPFISTEAVGSYVNGQDTMGRKYLGEKRYLDLKARGEYLLKNVKSVVEEERSQRDVYAGSFIFPGTLIPFMGELYSSSPGMERWQPLNFVKKELANIHSPLYVGLERFYSRNYFSGDNISAKVFLANDYQDSPVKSGVIKAKLLNSDSTSFFEWEQEVDMPAMSLQTFPLEIKIPEGVPTGDYIFNLSLVKGKKGKEVLHGNNYPLRIMARKDLILKIDTDRRILLISSENNLAGILKNLSISNDFWNASELEGKDWGEIRKYNVLIIGPDSISPYFTVHAADILGFVKDGGRLLCLNQRMSLFRGWVGSPNNTFFSNIADGYQTLNTFVDIKDETHPIFKGLSWDRFDTWNENYGVISEAIFFPKPPLPKGWVLAEAGQGQVLGHGTAAFGPVIINLRYGKGEYLLTQLKAVERYGRDPVATKYLDNLLNYMLCEKIFAETQIEEKEGKNQKDEVITVGPFSPDKDGFIRHWLICGPFPNPGGRPYGDKENQTGFNVDFFMANGGEGECRIIPSAGDEQATVFPKTKYYSEICESRLKNKWQKEQSEDFKVNLIDKFDFYQNVAAYAACYVESSEDRDVNVKLGSDDGFKLWLNHNPAGELNVTRGCKEDSNAYRLRLKKGMNLALLKVIQDTGGFEFCLRFTDLNDKPITDLKIWLAPNK